VPGLPEGAGRALACWQRLNQLRDFPAAGGVIMAQAGLGRFEVGLLATIETTMQAAWKKQAPVVPGAEDE
jgi:spermidine synthase